ASELSPGGGRFRIAAGWPVPRLARHVLPAREAGGPAHRPREGREVDRDRRGGLRYGRIPHPQGAARRGREGRRPRRRPRGAGPGSGRRTGGRAVEAGACRQPRRTEGGSAGRGGAGRTRVRRTGRTRGVVVTADGGDRADPEHLVVGHIPKAHGTKGELFVWPLTDRPES